MTARAGGCPAVGRGAQHMELAAGQAVGGEALGEQGRKSSPGQTTRPRRHRAARVSSVVARRRGLRLAQERDPERLGQPGGEGGIASRDSTRRSCGLQSAAQVPLRSIGQRPAALRRLSSSQPSPISVAQERLEHGHAPRGGGRQGRPRCSTRMPAGGAISAQTSRERLARRQHSPALLAGDGDETEIADRGAVRLRVAVDHDHPLAEPRGRQRMGEADDAGPDDREIERAGAGCAHRIRQARGRARDRPEPTACRCLRWRPR